MVRVEYAGEGVKGEALPDGTEGGLANRSIGRRFSPASECALDLDKHACEAYSNSTP